MEMEELKNLVTVSKVFKAWNTIFVPGVFGGIIWLNVCQKALGRLKPKTQWNNISYGRSKLKVHMFKNGFLCKSGMTNFDS